MGPPDRLRPVETLFEVAEEVVPDPIVGTVRQPRSHGEVRYHRVQGERRGTWIITAEPNVTMRLKRVFGRIDPKRDGSLWISDTPDTGADVQWVLSRWPLTMNDATRARLEESVAAYEAAREAVDRIFGGERLRFAREPIREPRGYQLEAADLALTTGRLLLGDDVGLGKTFSSLLMLRHPESLPAVVVCPLHLQEQWAGEIRKTFPKLRIHIVQKTTVYDPSRKRGAHGRVPDVLVMSYSKIFGWADHLAGETRTAIFDEAQELRISTSQKYRACARLADDAMFVMGTTATPVYNYGGELYNVMQVIAPDSLGTRAEFIQEWGSENNGKVTVKNPQALGAHIREEGLFLRRTRKDVGRELGDCIRVPHLVDADADVLNREATDVAGLASLILSGAGTGEERMRAAGDLDWRMRRATGLAKAPYVAAFVRMLLESEAKVVLWGWHRDVYGIWHKAFDDAKIGYAMYTGSETPAAKIRENERFLGDEKCRVLIMSLRSGAGLDGLQEVCRVGVMGELDWSPAMHDQCLGRLHRDGQEDPVVGYFLTCEFGSDPTILDTLGVKRSQAEPIRDPTAPVLVNMNVDPNRIKRLAEAVLKQQNG